VSRRQRFLRVKASRDGRPESRAQFWIDVEPLITRADRAHTLEAEAAYFVAKGWRVRTITTTQAELVKGEPVSHGLHIFFSIATVGLWLLVYVPLLVFGGEKHKHISVDEHGRVTVIDGSPRDT
jgi:hypothetical protein